MEILKTEQYIDEKLDIKPVTKTRLSTLGNPPKRMLKSGDGVILNTQKSTLGIVTYISYEDVVEYKEYYESLSGLELILVGGEDLLDGFLVYYDNSSKKFAYMNASIFNDNLFATFDKDYYISGIMRPNIISTPLTLDFFKRGYTLGNSKFVWKRPKRLNEKLTIKPISKTTLSDYKGKYGKYKYFPKTKEELKDIIHKRIQKEGIFCNLNDIDVSLIYEMAELFRNATFQGDISEWDVSNVRNMHRMFYHSYFNGDISKWNVSNVEDMSFMFANSKFNGDISYWDVSSVTNMERMFIGSVFNGSISDWDVSNVVNMDCMFAYSKFNGDLSRWNTKSLRPSGFMFTNSPLDGKAPYWYDSLA